ncbi:hypothetical protein D3C72_1980200 [compost metagenome]
MMKATAPMIGGMICPPMDEVASTPPAKAARKPNRFISGMVNWPLATTLATPDPEMVPISAEDSVQTCAGPPRQPPTRPRAKSLNSLIMPARSRKAAKTTKMKI